VSLSAIGMWLFVLPAVALCAAISAVRPRDPTARRRCAAEAVATALLASILVGVLIAYAKISNPDVDPMKSSWHMCLTTWLPLWLLLFAPQWFLGTWFACFRIRSAGPRTVALSLVALSVPAAVWVSIHWHLQFPGMALAESVFTATTVAASLLLGRERAAFAA